MKKNILRDSIILAICIFVTYIVFYYYVSELLTRFMTPSITLYLGLLIFTATVLYIVLISILNRRISRNHINTLAVMYFGITIGLSFFKTVSAFNGINLNPLEIIIDFKNYFHHTLLLVVTNSLLYFPLGLFVKYKAKINNLGLLIGFLFYILVVESIQYIFHRGVFDINDIILNTIGFFLGVLCGNPIRIFLRAKRSGIIVNEQF